METLFLKIFSHSKLLKDSTKPTCNTIWTWQSPSLPTFYMENFPIDEIVALLQRLPTNPSLVSIVNILPRICALTLSLCLTQSLSLLNYLKLHCKYYDIFQLYISKYSQKKGIPLLDCGTIVIPIKAIIIAYHIIWGPYAMFSVVSKIKLISFMIQDTIMKIHALLLTHLSYLIQKSPNELMTSSFLCFLKN